MGQAMKGFSRNDVVEKGLLAILLCERSRKTIGVVSMIVTREDFQDLLLGRIFAAVKLWSTDEECHSLASELREMFLYCGDEVAANAVVELACVPYPGHSLSKEQLLSEIVKLALSVRDQANEREHKRLEEEAILEWAEEEEQRSCIIPVETAEDLKW